MTKILLLLVLLLLCSCTTIRVEAPKGTVNVTADKTITTTPSLTASPSGNTVPVSAAQ